MLRPTESCQTRGNRSSARLDRDGHRDTLAERRSHRQRAMIDVDVVLVLPAVAIEALAEVALVVVEADADERNAEVRGALDVIAGQDAEAARIDRQRFVDAELAESTRPVAPRGPPRAGRPRCGSSADTPEGGDRRS